MKTVRIVQCILIGAGWGINEVIPRIGVADPLFCHSIQIPPWKLFLVMILIIEIELRVKELALYEKNDLNDEKIP